MEKKLLSYIIIGLTLYACSKNDLPVGDTQKAILGKWQLTHLGNGSEAPPYQGNPGYQEYLPDSVMRILNPEEEEFIYQKYWFDDSLLVERATYIDAIDKDTIVILMPYKYEFLNRNKLRLDLQNPAIFTTSIFKRMK
jgi:hypothetical protein